jgi:putative nucleotidyltransferase with HDIG domain
MDIQANYWLKPLTGNSIRQRQNITIEKKKKMTIKNRPLPIWHTIQISLLALAVWVLGAMTFMPAFKSHSARLIILIILITGLITVVRLTSHIGYSGYLISAATSAVGIPAYYLIYPITGHGEWVFALIVIAICSQWGTRPGLTAALLSATAYGFISYHQTGDVADAFILAGLFAVSAVIIGALVKHREVALVARARMADELEKTSAATLVALSRALDARDQDTEGHSERVSYLAVKIGQAIKLNETDLHSLRLAALLHDIGKIGIPDAILHKPDSLNEEEWNLMRKHPQTGYNILQNIPFLIPTLDGIRHHHEKYNGKGYPDGLSGDAISLPARILTIVDAYDALTSNRPYRLAFSQEKALEIINQEAGQHFDPKIVQVLAGVLRSGTSI